ncbi:IPT/TIG domain-containing protein [Candidatus Falkowbacteria bacterium]|nr:IPT/TIG domain-containing protein [Candidatus Falkowbacteria bacterium]
MFARLKKDSRFLIAVVGAVIIFSLFAFSALDIVHAQGTPEEGLALTGTAAGLQAGQDLRVIIGNIIKIILGFLGVLALCIVLYAGFLYMTSGGDQEKVQKARRWLVNGAIGLVIIFSAYAITSFIINKLKTAVSGEEASIAGGGGEGGLGIGGIMVFTAGPITPNTPAAINYPVKVFFNKGVDSKTINKDNVQIIKKGAKGKVVKTLAPIEVIEKGGQGADSLSKILVSDDQFTGWDVCLTDTSSESTKKISEGYTPMSMIFDISELKGKLPSSATYKFENKNSPGGRFTISCGDKNNPAKKIIKEKWATSDKPYTQKVKNSLELPKECFNNVADNLLYIQWKRAGGACIKFDYMALEMAYEDYTGAESAVSGGFNVSGSTVRFLPADDCKDPACKGQKCFEKNTDYKVVLKPNVIKSNTGIGLSCAVGSVCLHEFSTNDVCDVTAPAVSFIEPWNGAKVSQDADVDVTVKAIDDGGVDYIDFLVDSVFQDKATPASGKNEQEFYGYFSWNTEDIVLDPVTKKAVKKLKAEAEDLDNHLASKEIEVTVLPAYCFDKEGAIICDKDGTHPECGKCDGSDCVKDDDCAGVCNKKCVDAEAKQCKVNADCASGVACKGTCETLPVITNVSPDIAGAGNYVTIFGKGFLSYKEGVSQAFFTGAAGGYLEAKIVNCVAGKPAWSYNQIIVKVPELAGTGPIKIINSSGKEDDTQDEDGWQGEFEFDAKIKYPGLCAVQLQSCTPSNIVSCDEGAVGDSVKAIGINFGHEMADYDMIYFGSAPFGQGAGFDWKDKEIKGIQIPIVNPASYGVTVAKEDSKDINKKIYSNPVYFHVIPAANLPKIDKVSPMPAPFGQMVTISGQYFGANVGHVEFRRYINGQPYDWVAGLACASGSWSDSEIIIKVPKEIANTIAKIEGADAFSKDYQIIVYNSKGLASKPVDFEINNKAPGPGLCSISPNNGPVGTKFNLSGENFGESKDYYIKFPAPDKKNVNVTAFKTWGEKLIENAAVPAGAISGAVFLSSNAADVDIDSNSLNFSVGSCKKDSCDEGLTCCPTGICQTKCEAEVEYSPSEYMWLVSTGPLPILPQVLERSCIKGVYSQSPSPFKSTEDACPNGLISATFNTAMKKDSLNNNIEVRRCFLKDGGKCDFSICKKGEKLGDIICAGGEVKCLKNGTCVAKSVSQITANDFSESNLSISCKTPAGADCSVGAKDCQCVKGSLVSQFNLFDALSELAAGEVPLIKSEDDKGKIIPYQLFENTWYQVIIKGGTMNDENQFEGGVVSSDGKSMASDYAWTFKTKNEKCVPDNLLLKPLIGLISDLYGMQKYIVSGQYQCQEIALNNEKWEWGAQESYKEKIKFSGYGCVNGIEGQICPANTNDKRPDIGFYGLFTEKASTLNLETPLGEPAIIFADAVPTVDSFMKTAFDKMHKEGGLEVKFAAPKVISYYPNCQSACINSELGAHFSAQMDAASLTPNSVKLYSCASADCINLTSVALTSGEIDYQWTAPDVTNKSQISNLKVNPTNDLSSNTFYRMVITNGVQSSSLKPLAGLNYTIANAPKSDCADWKDNDADNGIDVSGGYIYKGNDKKILDFVCGCYNTSATGEPAQKFVSYNKVDAKVACPTGVSFSCFNIKESIITDPVDLKKIVEDYNYFSPDSQCASEADFEIGKSGQYDAFSWVFKTKASSEKCEIDKVDVVPVSYTTEKQGEKIEYWSNPYSAPDECSDKGQLLDPFDYAWKWDSTAKVIVNNIAIPAIAEITNTKIMDVPEYCTENCLAKGGTPAGSVCGDGAVGSGEECDDKNIVNGDGCSDKCLLEPFKNCTADQLKNKATGCCGNGTPNEAITNIYGKTYNEECDAGCEYKDGSGKACAPSADKPECVCVSKESYCSNGCLNIGTAAGFVCGNSKVEAGEDKDDGNNKDGDGVSSICLNEGAKYKTGEKAALCGDGKIDYGEECEAIAKTAGGSISLDNNPYCNEKCLWQGFPACGKCEKKVVDPATGKETVTACLPTDPACGCYKCCGNAQLEDYDNTDKDDNINTDFDEECEATALSCVKKTKTADGKEKIESCDYLKETNCVCELKFPEWCSPKCLNLGSSYKYDSYCGDGYVGNEKLVSEKPGTKYLSLGEDEQCEDAGSMSGAPYQVAIIKEIMDFFAVDSANKPIFSFNAATKFVEGATKIIATATVDKDGKSVGKTGEADLKFRTNDPDVLAKFCSTELWLSAGSSPTENQQNVCRNALLSFNFDKQLDTASASVVLYKVVGSNSEPVESSFAATNVGGKTHIIVTPKSLLDATKDYKVKMFNIKNVCGFYFSPWTLNFKTGSAVCKLDKIKIEPAEEFAFAPNQIHLFQALAMSGEEAINEAVGLYEWTWTWTADDTTIVSAPVACAFPQNSNVCASGTGVDSPTVNVTNQAKNGTATIFAETKITKDVNVDATDENAKSTVGETTSGSAKLQVLICENLWQPTTLPANWDTWKITSTNLSEPVSTHVYEKNYNIGLLYCRDFGQPNNKTDDLPKVKIITMGGCQNGIDDDMDGKIDALETKIFTDKVNISIQSKDVGMSFSSEPVNFVKQGKTTAITLKFTLTKPVQNLFTLNIEFFNNDTSIGSKNLIGINNNIPKYFPFDQFLNYGNVAFKVIVKEENSIITTTMGFLENNDSDPKCKTKDDSEIAVGNLLTEYFLTRDETETDNSTDVIALRIYKNPEFLAPSVWYQKYAPNPADTTSSLSLDCQKDEFGEFCYSAAVDGPSVYVGASNLAGGTTPGIDIYNNIHILSHSQSANEATLNIFNQIVAYLQFNFNLGGLSKVSLIRDTQRIQDMVWTRLVIDQYKQKHNGEAPQLESGTYERGLSFSVWPSWQNELGGALKQTLPVDPLNHFKWEKPSFVGAGIACLGSVKCPDAAFQCVIPNKYCVKCPTGFDALTCYDSNTQKFFNYYSNPDEHPVYSYQADPENAKNKSAYKLDFMLEITSKIYKITTGF